MKRLAIIGGGAAGLAAAIAAGEWARDEVVPLEVTVFERDDRVGRSILATGNGRCNFSNARPYADEYRNGKFVEDVFHNLLFAFGAGASSREQKIIYDNGDVVHAFFYKHGLMWREEDDGRQYPKTNKASTVVDILRASAAQVGVQEACEREVRAIEPPRGEGRPFTLRMKDSVLERADAVIVACGGRALAALEPAGLPVKSQQPVLGPLRVADSCIPIVRELDNIRVRCSVSLVRKRRDAGAGDGAPDVGGVSGGADTVGAAGEAKQVVATEVGELMFRKYGVSGICAFNLSRFARPGDELHVNFLDGAHLRDAEHHLFSRRKLLAERFCDLTCEDMLRGLVLPRVADAVLKQAGLEAGRAFTKGDVPALAKAMTEFSLDIAGIGDSDLCQVRRGGLAVSSFNPSTMAAREVPGLYAAGEALDVDGPCGGFNLHWAWASGLLAGRSAAMALAEGDVESGGVS